MISLFNFLANFIDKLVLPIPVGPTIVKKFIKPDLCQLVN